MCGKGQDIILAKTGIGGSKKIPPLIQIEYH